MILPLLLAFATPNSADTIQVMQAQIDGPFTMQVPYMSEARNMQGKTFDINEALQYNESQVLRSGLTETKGASITHGNALNCIDNNTPTMRQLHFTIQTEKFIKGRIEINHLKNYNLFINGQKNTDKTFELTPGRAQVTLQVLTQKEDKDTFDVKLIGDDLKDVVINSRSKRPYTMADMMLGDHYYNVSLSPSGKYLVTINYFTKNDGSTEYSTVLTETETEKVLIRKNEYSNLKWLKTGDDLLYYTRQGTNGKELVIFNPKEGKEQILAKNLPEGDFYIAPNLKYLIFSKSEKGKPSSNGIKFITEPDDRMPNWRNRNSLWRYDLSTGLIHRLTYGSTSIQLADISDDSNHLLLQYSHVEPNRVPFTRTTILRMNAYTAKVDTLLNDTTHIASVQFSPDARQLLIQADPDAFEGIGSELKNGQIANGFDYRLYLYDIDTHQTKALLPHFNPSVDSYEWSRGENKVYFVAINQAFRTLHCLNMDNREITNFELPINYIQKYSIATSTKNPKAVFFGQNAERAREMFTCRLNKNVPSCKRIGNINFDKIYEDVAIGKCYNWQFKASRGDSIDGFYILPPYFDKNKKYPLIVYYYGGCMPTSQTLEFQYPLQVMAGQGYIVYVPNPSGTIGYGQEFASRHVNTWGKESGDDIIEGTQAFCKAHPFVDIKRIGCIGASYGGFMTQYLQTRTNIFATAISHAGISNITSYWGGGYWGYSYGEVAQFGSYPWNNPDLYVKQSPLFNADKIHTPLLLLHGTADTNVPTNESQQMFNALKILGREVCYVQVEGENHAVANYHKRLAWQNVIFAWFAKYLKKDSTWWNSLGF